MEQSSLKSDKEQDKSIVSLLGQLTDFKSELSGLEEDKLEEINIQKGDFTEKYFNQKLKYQLKSNEAFSSSIDVSEVHDDMILSLNYALVQEPKDPQLDPETAVNIIKQIDLILKDENQIQIDSLLPSVDGKELSEFFNKIKDYSFPSDNKIDINKKYTVIAESTFSLHSQINIKVNQLRKSYLLFSLIHNLYLKYPKYIQNYYKYFIKRYIIKSKYEKKDYVKDDKLIDLSSYGNYIFLIVSNKALKSFHEIKDSISKSQYNVGELPELSFIKCFDYEKLKEIEAKKTFAEDKNSANPKPKKDFFDRAYKDMNYLINNINNSENYFAKLIYLDTYLNLITPKCEIMEKMEKLFQIQKTMNDKINKIEKRNEKLFKIISKVIPDFSLSDLDDNQNDDDKNAKKIKSYDYK